MTMLTASQCSEDGLNEAMVKCNTLTEELHAAMIQRADARAYHMRVLATEGASRAHMKHPTALELDIISTRAMIDDQIEELRNLARFTLDAEEQMNDLHTTLAEQLAAQEAAEDAANEAYLAAGDRFRALADQLADALTDHPEFAASAGGKLVNDALTIAARRSI